MSPGDMPTPARPLRAVGLMITASLDGNVDMALLTTDGLCRVVGAAPAESS